MRWIFITLLCISCTSEKTDLIFNDPNLSMADVEPNQSRQEQDQEQDLPNCDQLCTKDYRVLKGRNSQRDYLAFQNFGYRGVGRCRGHAIVNQKVYELANFKEDLNHKCNTTPMTEACFQEIKTKLSRLMKFEVQTFHGFKNLYQFSHHPRVQSLLKSYVRGISHRYRAIRADIRVPHEDNEDLATFEELTYRIKENQRPYIGIKGEDVGHHAVIAHSIDYKDSKEVLCVHDSNIIFHKYPDNCQNYIYHDEENIFYKRHNKDATKLYTFALMSDEDLRVERYIQARYNFCVESNRKQLNCK